MSVESSSSLTEVERDLTGRRRVPVRLQLVYGTGHVLNDVCASMWFTYLLVYFQLVLGFGAKQAGLVLLVGQVADALATPFVGYHSDVSSPHMFCSYGRRKTWHLFGTVCVLGSFPFIFSECITCENAHKWAQLIYYCAFVVVFQIGWAAVQVSHLSLIPELSVDEHERTHLTAVRYSFTVFSNILVYIVTWVVLHITNGSEQQIGPHDAGKFHHIVAVGVGIGMITSIMFHCFLREPTPLNLSIQNESTSFVTKTSETMSHKSMLKSPKFYQIGVVYMCTRLFVNLTQVFTPLYLHKTLSLPGVTLASVPLVMYMSSLVTSLAVRPLNRVFGRKVAYSLGGLIAIAGCVWLFLGEGPFYTKYGIYIVVVIFGSGGALMLVTSLGLTADLIGNATNTAAFVYGSMSFTDKLANGLVVIVIEHFAENADPNFYRWAISIACGGAAAVAIFATLFIRQTSIIIVNEEETPILNATDS